MTELVQRLRRTVYRNGHYKDDTRVPVNPDGPEAADRIEVLEAENERLREALEMIAGHVRDERYSWRDDYKGCVSIARAALETKQ